MAQRPTLALATVAAALALVPAFASAQMTGRTTGMSNTEGRSYIPYTSQGYVGLNVGRTNFPGNCRDGYNCDEDSVGFKVYTGGQLWRLVGLELAYINMGKAESSGGSIKAQGVNLSLVGNVPVGPVNVFGKVGTTYGWTKTTGFASGYNTGNDNGFGLSYGAGVGYDINRNLQVLAEWERHRFQLANGNDEIQMWSAGLKYKF